MSVRILALMGSGETSPTMVKTHRDLIGRVDGPAAMLDTPFGFQMNADDLAARAVGYFRDSVGVEIGVVRYRHAAEQGSVGFEHSMAILRSAAYVFAGPGSPSYALRQWSGSPVPDLLREKLRLGGCVAFSSAAALTIGVATVPVYEVYKVGEEPRWLPGLDLLAEAGLSAAVIPHFDNAEGTNHDTRFCYLGEERLSRMERDLPSDAFVLGIDEHTACIIDLDALTATVIGRGTVTARSGGSSHRWEAGSVVGLDELRTTAAHLGSGRAPERPQAPDHGRASSEAAMGAAPSGGDPRATSPMLEAAAAQDKLFTAAMADRDTDTAMQAVLDLEAELHEWAADPTQSDEIDQARAILRSMIVRLGQVAQTGARDPRDVIAPFVEMILASRRTAREERRFADSDALRDRLVALGVEVQDSPEGTEWSLPD